MGLAQKIALSVMLDNDPSLIAEEGFAVNATLGGAGAVCVFSCVAALLSVRDIMFINGNQCNNDNHYQ